MRMTTPWHPGQRNTAPISWEYMCSAPMLSVRPQPAHVARADVTSRVNTSLNNPAAAFPSSLESEIMDSSIGYGLPVGPNRSVLMSTGSCPSAVNSVATDSTSGVGPHT